MSDIETKQRFVFLRAQGWSFARTRLSVSPGNRPSFRRKIYLP
jgi:hypothetical protein